MLPEATTRRARGQYVVAGATVRVVELRQHQGVTWTHLELTVDHLPAWRPSSWAVSPLPQPVRGAVPRRDVVDMAVERARDPRLVLVPDDVVRPQVTGYAHALLAVRMLWPALAERVLSDLLARRGDTTFSRSDGLVLRALDDWRQQIAAGLAPWTPAPRAGWTSPTKRQDRHVA